MEFKPENENALFSTVRGLGWNIVKQGSGYTITTARMNKISLQNGRAVGQPLDVNSLRVSYSQTLYNISKEFAKQAGWQVINQGENKMLIRKGY